MKSFNAFNQKASDNPYVSPIKLVKIAFDGLTLYLCDRHFGSAGSEDTFDGQIYEPLVLNWGDVDYGEVGQLGSVGTPGDFSFRVDNTIPIAGFDSFTSIFGIYKPIFSTITLYEIFEDASSAADMIILFIGSIEDVDMELEWVNLNCTSIELSLINKFSVEICTEEDYPDADPDDWGAMFPVVYGGAKRVPFLAVDAGALGILAEDISASVTEIDGSDLSKFPQGGGTIQIGSEQMTYSYIDENTFKIVTRAQNDSDAFPHETGATIAEIQTEYFYAMAHAINAFNGVYVINRKNNDNVLQNSSIYTLYTGQSGDEHASYPGRACIVFNTLPTIAPQVNIEVEDTIDVDDNISVSDTIGVDTGLHDHGGDRYYVWQFEYATDTSSGGGFIDEGIYDPASSRFNISNGDYGSYCYMSYAGAQVTLQKTTEEQGPGTPSYFRLGMVVSFQNTLMRAQFVFNGRTLTSAFGAAGQGILTTGWYSTSLTWAQINALIATVTLQNSSGAAGSVVIRNVWVEFQHSEVDPSPATGVAKTGSATKAGLASKIGTVTLVGNSVADTVIGGRVSADVDGWQADDSGDYGTEDSLIQRPDYVLKHFLVNYCGVTIASNIDEDEYNASGTLYVNDNVEISPVLVERPDIMEFLTYVAGQCKSYQYWVEGKHVLKRVPVTDTVDKTIEGGRIDLDSVKVRYTPRDQIINKYVLNFEKHWVAEETGLIQTYKSVVSVESAPSQAVYGILEGDPINLDYVYNSTQALRVGNWLLDDTAFPRLIVEFAGGHYLSDLELGDIIEFTFDSGDELDRRLLGLVVSDSDQFRIMSMNQTERGRIWIQAYIVLSSTSDSGSFYPSALNDDGYTQGANFYNTTLANIIGSYSGDPYTTTTTTTSSSTSSTASTISTSSSTSSTASTLSTTTTTTS